MSGSAARAEADRWFISPWFAWYWFAQTMSGLGDRLTAFTVQSTAILVLSASSQQVGVLSATGWLAYPVLGLVAGAALSYVRRKGVLITAELVRFLAFAAVALAVGTGHLTLPYLVAAVAVAGAATVFTDIGGQSYLPSVVARDRLVGANSRLSGADSITKLAGPAIAGAVFGLIGPASAMALAALPFLLSAAGRTPIRAREVVAVRPDRPEPVPARLRRDIAFVLGHPVLGLLVRRSALRGFGVGAVDAVLLLFAYRGLDLSAVSGGLLMAAGSVGALLGAASATRIIGRLGARPALMLTGIEGAAWLALPLCALGAPFAVLVGIRTFSAFWLPVWTVLDASLRQSLAPVGRESTVHAVTRTLSSSAIPLGAVTGGGVAGLLGAHLGPALGFGTVLAVGGLVVAVSALYFGRSPVFAEHGLATQSSGR